MGQEANPRTAYIVQDELSPPGALGQNAQSMTSLLQVSLYKYCVLIFYQSIFPLSFVFSIYIKSFILHTFEIKIALALAAAYIKCGILINSK